LNYTFASKTGQTLKRYGRCAPEAPNSIKIWPFGQGNWAFNIGLGTGFIVAMNAWMMAQKQEYLKRFV
jgi:hypothetical protein